MAITLKGVMQAPVTPLKDDFSFDGADGDDVWLMVADPAGNLVRFADHADFGPARSGTSAGGAPSRSPSRRRR